MSGEIPGSPPADGQVPNASGVTGAGIVPPLPGPTLLPLPPVPLTVPLPAAPWPLLLICPLQARRPVAKTARVETIRRSRGQDQRGAGSRWTLGTARILPSTNPETGETVQGGACRGSGQ